VAGRSIAQNKGEKKACTCYLFGSKMESRSWAASGFGYRHGFNGKEQDNEVSGSGNTIAFEARIYDSRLGRFFSTDPREREYPWQSTYAFIRNNPVALIDHLGEGDEPKGENTDPSGQETNKPDPKYNWRNLTLKGKLRLARSPNRWFQENGIENMVNRYKEKMDRKGIGHYKPLILARPPKEEGRDDKIPKTNTFSFKFGLIKPVFSYDKVAPRTTVTLNVPDGGLILTMVRAIFPTGFMSPNNNGQSTYVFRNPFSFSIPLVQMYWQGKITRTTISINRHSSSPLIKSKTETTTDWSFISISPVEWMNNLKNIISDGIQNLF
jgi:RHS repeat-associated protein